MSKITVLITVYDSSKAWERDTISYVVLILKVLVLHLSQYLLRVLTELALTREIVTGTYRRDCILEYI